ncbi:DNA-binding GntR family transcriptional regulator [Chitinivorax tropicus]|uniref:DNA-binding GntR family transcriptional regulator n=1 Tax=Chitinivorax tropicus TaxID=714531 RepID=A0A840MIE6_9PROT|nr:GntR family transcriptional regulator [Chitinivorax tropicus]MBB5018984.1 DNA-binding GntR family transcriptional regulator [Chitinivorax tropicus]
MSSLNRVQQSTLTATATEALRSRILSGHYPEGMQLRQEAISRDLGMSRVPVREALRQLEAEGLVNIVEHKGAVVTTLVLEEVVELLRIRVLLECDLLMDAVPRQTQQDLDVAEAVLQAFDQSMAARDVLHWGTLNAQFHLALYRPAQRPHTLALIEQLHNRTERYTRMQLMLTDASGKAQMEHMTLLNMCRHKDAIGAAAFLRQHILGAEASLEAYFRKQQAS